MDKVMAAKLAARAPGPTKLVGTGKCVSKMTRDRRESMVFALLLTEVEAQQALGDDCMDSNIRVCHFKK